MTVTGLDIAVDVIKTIQIVNYITIFELTKHDQKVRSIEN